MKEMRRVLALLLCFVMLVGYIPVGALATETEPTVAVETQPVEEVVEAVFGEAVSASDEKADSTPVGTEAPAAETEAPVEETEVVEEIIEAVFGEEISASKPVTPAETEPAETEAQETVPAETEPAEVLEEVEASEEAEAALAAVSAEVMEKALEEAEDYVADLVKANNPPSTIVESVGTHFSWDYEKRESKSSAKYLYEWSYYNGVVFEGLDNLAEVTGNQEYAKFVESYLDAMITDGALNSYAGYVDYHGADCYKTADLLLDYWYSTGDGEYYDVATTLYNDLQNAKAKYTNSAIGGNFYHSWKSAAENGYDLWLDGLYMILPFMAEYAEYFDEDELKLIVDRLTWVSNKMYDSDTKLFSHAYDAADGAYNNKNKFWGRAIGWYAAALVDVMDHMPESDQTKLAAQLKKLVDGMLGYQTSNGMWRQFVNVDTSVEETSVTALMGYAIMKAVNEGWLEGDKYTNAATNAFVGICNNPLDESGLHYICHKGAVNNYEEPTYAGQVNEGKGAGPFIMLYAEVLEHWGVESEPEAPKTVEYITINQGDGAAYKQGDTLLFEVLVTYDDFTTAKVTQDDCTYTIANAQTGEAVALDAAMATVGTYTATITYEGVECGSKLHFTVSEAEDFGGGDTSFDTLSLVIEGVKLTGDVKDVTEDETVVAAMATLEDVENFMAFEISAEQPAEGETATVTVIIPEGWNTDNLRAYYINDAGEVAETIEGTFADGKFTFEVSHFSTWAVGDAVQTAEGDDANGLMATGNLPGGKVYKLDTNGITANKNYLIVSGNSGTVNALTNNNGSAGSTPVPVSGDTITVTDDANIAWKFSNATNGNVSNNGRYVYPNNRSLSLNTGATNLAIGNRTNGAYRISRSGKSGTYYLQYSSGWTANTTASNVYLYEYDGDAAGGTVTLELIPEKTSIKPGETLVVTPVVKVNGTEISDYTIVWESEETDKATVSNGTVTGKADGTANISATLTAAKGAAPVSQVKVTFAVTVQSREIDHLELVTSQGTVVKNSPADTDTGAKLRIVYKDGGTEEVAITLGMVSGSSLDITKADTYHSLTVSYGGKDVGGFTLNVNHYPGNNFPEYPDAGSVAVNKVIGDYSQFQETGVAEVQLSTSGVPIIKGVDVVLVADISNSMTWKAGTLKKSPKAGETTKWQDLQAAAGKFIDTLLEDNTYNNTVSFVMFGGYDAQRNANASSYTYFDATRTLFTSSMDAASAKSQINAFSITSNDDSNHKLTINGQDGGAPQGGTNYDHAFQETALAINQIKADYKAKYKEEYDASGREIYVVFMTDGAPDHYNQLYYKTRSTSQFDYYALYNNSTDLIDEYFDTHTVPNYRTYVKRQANGGYYLPSSDMANDQWTDWIQSAPLAAAEYVANMPRVNSITAIGFDLPNGAFGSFSFDEEILTDVLTNLAGEDSCEVLTTADPAELNAFYESLAHQIRQAATSAFYVDQMGSSFDIQTAAYVTKFGTQVKLNTRPKMTVSTYPVYTKAQVDGVTVTESMVGKRYGNPTPVETVTFSDDGKDAYSNLTYTFQYKKGDTVLSRQVTGSTVNIVEDGVIYAKNFWYNTNKQAKTIILADGSEYLLPAETFYWNIGTINQKEFVLSYYVYLTGAAEGDAHRGTYATNNFATLYYENYLGNDVSQDVQSPTLAWESAAVYYGFYLVDQHGRPLLNQTTGETGSFEKAIKVTQKIFSEEVLLNDVGTAGTTIQAISENVPAGYTVYDDGATYTIAIDSGKKVSGWTIVNTKNVDENENNAQDNNEQIGTTYVTDYRGTESTNVTLSSQLDQEGVDYTSTTVWFAVVWGPGAIPDSVVIDYGLPVDISVLANDLFGVSGTVTGLGTAKPAAGTQFTAETLDLTYGNAKINGSKVRYTPKTMMMNSYDQFLYEVYYDNSAQAEKKGYYYGEVTVIPATTIYYEDSFTDGGITYTGSNVTWGVEGVASDLCQAEDRPGKFSLSNYDANNVYGFDGAYETMSQFSMNGAHKVHVNADSYAMAEFEFYGTGFDVMSMTSNKTGTLAVKVFSVDANGVASKTAVKSLAVDTYYGYDYDQYYTLYVCKNDTWTFVMADKDDSFEAEGIDFVENLADAEKGEGNYVYTQEMHWQKVNTTDSGNRANYDEESGEMVNNEEALYQVPVIKMELPTYGRYKVQIAAIYYPTLDHTFEEDGYDLYLDAIRIYNPAGTTYDEGSGDTKVEGDINDVIQDAYIADGEGWPKYIEVRNKIIKQGNFNLTGSTSGAIFIDQQEYKYEVADYISYGPNNEMYLAPGQAIAFSLNLGPITDDEGNTVHQNKVADVQIGLKSADGKEVKVTMGRWSLNNGNFTCVNSTAILGTGSSTDRYFSIGNHVDKRGNTLLTFQNTGDDGILSITNIKVTYAEQPVETGSTDDTMGIDESQAFAILNTFNKVQQEQMPEPLPEADLDVSIRKTSVKVGSSVVVKITTSADVDYLMVNGEKITKFSQNRQTGKRSWTATVKAEEAGELEIEVAAYSAKGAELDTETQTVEVTKAKASLAQNVIDTIISKLFR